MSNGFTGKASRGQQASFKKKKKRFTRGEEPNEDGGGYGNQILPVAQLPPDFDGLPLDGEQYLATVRLEAASHPSVYLAKHNPYAQRVMPLPPISSDKGKERSTQEDLQLPSEEWRETFVQRFTNMRESLTNAPGEKLPPLGSCKFPKPGDGDGWYRWIYGRSPPRQGEEEEEEEEQGTNHSIPRARVGEEEEEEEEEGKGIEEDEMEERMVMELLDSSNLSTNPSEPDAKSRPKPREPTAALLKRFQTKDILSLLDLIPQWFTYKKPQKRSRRGTGPAPLVDENQEEEEEDLLDPLLSRWIFSLLSNLDSRLVSEEISVLRTLARSSISLISLGRIRKVALLSRVGGTDASTSKTFNEAPVWIVVVAISTVWGQSDLWQEAVNQLSKVPRL